MNLITRDTLWGIVRDESSPACGQLVCPIINLWKDPEASVMLEGAETLPHNTPVKVKTDKKIRGVRHYEIETVPRKNKVRGWVSAKFLKIIGAYR